MIHSSLHVIVDLQAEGHHIPFLVSTSQYLAVHHDSTIGMQRLPGDARAI